MDTVIVWVLEEVMVCVKVEFEDDAMDGVTEGMSEGAGCHQESTGDAELLSGADWFIDGIVEGIEGIEDETMEGIEDETMEGIEDETMEGIEDGSEGVTGSVVGFTIGTDNACEVMYVSAGEVDEFKIRMPEDMVLSDPAELTIGMTSMNVLVVQGDEETREKLVSVVAQQVIESVEDWGCIEGAGIEGVETGDEIEDISVDEPSWEARAVETETVNVEVPDAVHLVSVIVIDVATFAEVLVLQLQEGFGKISPFTAVSMQTQPSGVKVGMADVVMVERLD
ncbi:hypothetical protein LTS18_007089 [Coniosporium uncinatum]|uniref:Uncharacterized protein n=1 Tax=Coniosporium uncinatum TaxID=93489 RepID=A0ACC3DQ04_9PEZI|nr:hypothetical protein LTS18_007089 [Coniosporium uncinatum]